MAEERNSRRRKGSERIFQAQVEKYAGNELVVRGKEGEKGKCEVCGKCRINTLLYQVVGSNIM